MTQATAQSRRHQATLALDARATLGECIRWDERQKLIYWVDIPGRQLHRYDPATGRDDAPSDRMRMCFTTLSAGDLHRAVGRLGEALGAVGPR